MTLNYEEECGWFSSIKPETLDPKPSNPNPVSPIRYLDLLVRGSDIPPAMWDGRRAFGTLGTLEGYTRSPVRFGIPQRVGCPHPDLDGDSLV